MGMVCIGPRYAAEPRRAAFEEVVLGCLDDLHGAALRMTRQREDAEDVVQETLLRSFRSLDRFREGSDFRAWLFTILRNTFISYRRKNGAGLPCVPYDLTGRGGENGDQPEGIPRDWDADGPSCGEETLAEDLESALAKLPEESRRLVYLAHVEGLEHREIARIMRWPVGTVMSKLFRAREKLRYHLRDHRPAVASRRAKACARC